MRMILIVLVMIFSCPLLAFSDRETHNDPIARAKSLMCNNELAKAKELLLAFAKTHPENKDVYWLLASCF